MATKWKIQTASFAGVEFEWKMAYGTQEERAERRSYPDRDGEEIRRSGSGPLDVRLRVIVRNEDYPDRWKALLAAIRKGPGRFVHPTRGSFDRVHALMVEYEEGVDTGINAVEATIHFVQSGVPAVVAAVAATPLTTAAEGRAEVNDGLAAMRAANEEQTQYSLTLQQRLLAALRALANMGYLTSYFISDVLDDIDAWGNALAGAADAILDAAEDVATSVPDVIDGLDRELQEILEAIRRDSQLSEDVVYGLEQGTEDAPPHPAYAVYFAACASCYLGAARRACEMLDEHGEDMTANEVDRVCSLIRRRMANYARACRIIFADSTADPAGGMETAAAELLDYGEAAKATRPPLVKYVVKSERPLVLIAHELYADHTREGELHRLNPEIIEPTFTSAGMVLQTYAS